MKVREGERSYGKTTKIKRAKVSSRRHPNSNALPVPNQARFPKLGISLETSLKKSAPKGSLLDLALGMDLTAI